MTHPELESARLKLNRAREHIEGLKTEQERWAKDHPQPFAWRLQDDVEPDRILGLISQMDDPPGFMSTIVGDIVHNLRSSLDHITWQLVQHGTCTSLKPSDETQIQLPIYNTLPEFDANRKRRLPGVLDVQETIVRRYQPYQRGVAAADHPFAILEVLSNTDKHRNIHLTFWCASKAAFEVTYQPVGCLIKEMVPLLNLHDPLKIDAPLFFVRAADRTLCRGMKVEAKLTYQIAFQDGVWVHDRVSHIAQLASDLLAEIDGVL